MSPWNYKDISSLFNQSATLMDGDVKTFLVT